MQISKHKAVAIEYTLTNDSGEVIDTSEGQDPLSYLHGAGNLISGLEQALEGKSAGDALQVTISPEDAYGQRVDELVQKVPRDRFDGASELEVGMRFQASSDHGETLVTITEVSDDEVTVDGNHPLAGETLHFDVKVVDVRDASEEEVAHGHIHGPGGHDH
ncbi:MAG: peptidylprolyl isomerase [Acidiferrobacterales bacterium]|nr:peptidylprolyl isomerase [Acidiferrobacterales bacterium]